MLYSINMPHDLILIPRREWVYSLFWYRGRNKSIPYSNAAAGMSLFPILIPRWEWVYSLWVISGIRQCAAQEQELSTRYVRAIMLGNGNETKCRLCGEQNKTVRQIASGCKMIANMEYKILPPSQKKLGSFVFSLDYWCIFSSCQIDWLAIN